MIDHELQPCPFCGAGETRISEARQWQGMGYSEPISVSVRHWCTPIEGQPSRMIERIGRDLASAITAWNMRDPEIDRLNSERAEALLDAERAREERNREHVRLNAEWMAKCEDLRKDAIEESAKICEAWSRRIGSGKNRTRVEKAAMQGALTCAAEIRAAMAKKEGA